MKRPGLALLALLLVAASPASETEHVVRQGETLGGIANRAGVEAGDIARANGLKEPFAVRQGQTLKIPRNAKAARARPAPGGATHVVTDGETLGGIANRAGVPASAIARANGLEEPYKVRTGQTLVIPGGTKSAPAPTARARPAPDAADVHVVREGETLGGIANRAGLSAMVIARANRLEEPYAVRTGQRLTIPQASPAVPGKAARALPTAKGGPAALSGTDDYVVKEGETLGAIASRAGVPRIVIAEANGLREPYVVKPGQRLSIPRQRTHVVKKGETGFDIAYQYGIPFSRIAVANGLENGATLKPGQKLLIPAITRSPEAMAQAPSGTAVPAAPAPSASQVAARFRWPLTGAIREGFDSGSAGQGHNGIDIAAAEGEPVKAAASGIVIYAQMERTRFGNLVIIDHGDRWHTAYGHLSRIAAKKGASVQAGDVIGYVGSTGTAALPELHFEVRNRNTPVDPQTVLGPQG